MRGPNGSQDRGTKGAIGKAMVTVTTAPASTRPLNALRHGLRANSVLPWESQEEFAEFRATVHAEHKPLGPTEAALVDQVAGILWRLRRVRMAESAVWRSELQNHVVGQVPRTRTVYDALPDVGVVKNGTSLTIFNSDHQECEDEAAHARRAAAAARVALDDFCDREGTVDEALALLAEEDRPRWAEHAKEAGTAPDDEQEFVRFLDNLACAWDAQAQLIDRRDEARAQALGVSFNAERIEPIMRYETSLHRSLGRVLAMLMGLQDRRQSVEATDR